HHLDDGPHVIHWRFRQYAMSEVKDVARPGARAAQQVVDLVAQLGNRREQRDRIEVPLYRGAVGDIHPGLVDVDAPVAAHDIAARRMQLAEVAGSARAEMDD